MKFIYIIRTSCKILTFNCVKLLHQGRILNVSIRKLHIVSELHPANKSCVSHKSVTTKNNLLLLKSILLAGTNNMADIRKKMFVLYRTLSYKTSPLYLITLSNLYLECHCDSKIFPIIKAQCNRRQSVPIFDGLFHSDRVHRGDKLRLARIERVCRTGRGQVSSLSTQPLAVSTSEVQIYMANRVNN